MAHDLTKAQERMELYAHTINVDPPARLLCDEGAPSDELLMFCQEHGASLDWIFRGDVRGMIIDCKKQASQEQISKGTAI